MGGDHKCPVCQATFTRPQHVARHMRSHTGDRPYKCQHCGDQFARSDLLSRHVNKCHAAEKALAGTGAAQPGRRKGTTAASRATTSKQACDQCVQSSLPCDGSNPCSKCVTRKTRCTFVKFHRQTAPVGPGHPSSLPTLPASALSSSLPSHSSSLHPSLASLSAPLSLSLGGPGEPGQPQFLYAQQAAGGGGFQQQQPAFSANEPPTGRYGEGRYSEGRFSVSDRFAHHPSDGHPRYARGGGSNPASPTSTYSGVDGYQRRDSYTYPPPPSSSGSYAYSGEYDGYEYAESEHSASGASVSGGSSRPASSQSHSHVLGAGDYAPYLPNGRHGASASLDLHDLRHHPGDLHHELQRPPEFSSAFGLMSLDDPNVLAGLAPDGVPFFSGAGRTGLTPGGVPPGPSHSDDAGAKRSSMQLVPPQPLAYQAYSPPSSSHSHTGPVGAGAAGGTGAAQTPGSREAETRELREFWKAYMRTPLTGPSGADALGLQTPSASTAGNVGMLGATPTRESVAAGGNGGRRYRVASLPSVKTPEGEMDAPPVYPVHHHQQHQHQHAQQLPPLAGRTAHNADDLRSYEAAVLARKAPELVLRKPARRPTTSTGLSTSPQQQQQQQQSSPAQPPIFEFGAAGRDRGGAGTLEGAGSQSSLAGVFGFGQGYAAAPIASQPPAAASTGPDSPFPGTPNSGTSASASASEDGDGSSGDGGEGMRPSFKRLPSQTLGPPQTKRRRDRTGKGLGLGGGLAPLTLAPPSGGEQGQQQQDSPPSAPPSVNAYPDRPMIALRAPPQSHPHRRARRLSAPASPTGLAFVVD